jgi:hypothetical protein
VLGLQVWHSMSSTHCWTWERTADKRWEIVSDALDLILGLVESERHQSFPNCALKNPSL